MSTSQNLEREPATAREGGIDPITLEVLRHRLWMINDEQGRLAEQISGSPVVYESKDFNASILSPEGDSIFIGVYTTRISMSLHVATKFVIEHFAENPGIDEGDAYITNDPWTGAGHMNDFLVLAPIHRDGEIICWSGIALHDVDVGGPVPGGFTAGAKDVYNEPPLISPVRLVEGGQVRPDIEALILRNTRTPDLNALNLRARLAAVTRTRERVHSIVDEYGKDVFVGAVYEILALVRRAFERRLRELPDGTWVEEGYLDHDGIHDELYPIRLTMTKKDDHLGFDFEGTHSQVEGPVNSTWVGMESGVVSAVLPMLCYDMPWSPGALLSGPITITGPDGAINNANYPAAVSMATVGAIYETQQVASGAIARMLACSQLEKFQIEAQANWTSSWQGTIVSGAKSDGGHYTGLLLDNAGGAGAKRDRDGPDSAGLPGSPCQAIANVESYEHQYPLLYLYRKQCADTGGPGRRRGGVGTESMITPHKNDGPVEFTVTAHGVSHPECKGLFGGLPGSVQVRRLLRATDFTELVAQGRIPTDAEIFSFEREDELAAIDRGGLNAGDALLAVTSGGGGYGDPLQREPERVVRDVRVGMVSAQAARNVYGVILEDSGDIADLAGTEAMRRKIRDRRLQESEPGDPNVTANTNAPPIEGAGETLIGNCLAVVADNGGNRTYACSECGTRLGPVDRDPKRYALVRKASLDEISSWNVHGRTEEIRILEFYCPGCAQMIGSQVRRSDDPDLWDMSLMM